jgi:hypothetical protein
LQTINDYLDTARGNRPNGDRRQQGPAKGIGKVWQKAGQLAARQAAGGRNLAAKNGPAEMEQNWNIGRPDAICG